MIIFIIVIIAVWFFLYINSDGYIFDNGQKTEGIITSVQSRSQTDQYGKVRVSYIVSYQFQDYRERIWRGKFTIKSSACGFKELDKVEVFYLPNKPHKNAISQPHNKLR